jgi:hypothetical protein
MTNQLPNDLSHLSEEEFNSLCPQGEHAPGPQPLSPAAQAVLDAALETDFEIDFTNLDATLKASMKTVAAAALRAAADQVVPPEQERLFNKERPWDGELCAVVEIRQEILAIADELEGHDLP